MADIDFITDLSNGDFKISLTDNPKSVTGNRALMNRFEIVFLTRSKAYLLGEEESPVVDYFGGNGDLLITKPQVLNDSQGIIAAISVTIERTVKSIIQDQPDSLPDNEKLLSAQLLNMYIQNGIVFAQVKVNPVEVDSYSTLISNLPVIKR